METKTIKVIYDGSQGINEELDKKIITAMKAMGAKWYAQGLEYSPPFERDISFDMEV